MATYLAVQAALGVAWWVGLALDDGFRGWFELDPGQPRVLDAFAIADLLVFTAGSALASVAVRRRADWAAGAVAAVAGGTVYATLYLAGWLLLGGHGWIGLAPMTVASTATMGCAMSLRTRA